jgi:hypothetical protein
MPDEPRIHITVTEERFDRYDPAHGTPDPMIRRVATIRLPTGEATFEQTDYGHPGKFNAWDPRGIATKLQPRSEELRAICTALTPLLS